MISNKVIERLKRKNWFVTSRNEQEASLVLQACDDAGITWNVGYKATEFKPYTRYPVDIGFHEEEGITYGTTYYKESEIENITDWFFNAIKNNDSKLTPQNAEQEHLVQMLLAKLQGIPVECWSIFGHKWVDSTSHTISTDTKYRLKQEPTLTPLPISRELWSYIDKKWSYAAMEQDGRIFFYHAKPIIDGDYWSAPANMSESPLNINTDGINWETSLTERPEDV